MKKHFCPCCGYKTLAEKPPGTFEICEICYWEDDNVQFDNLNYEGGANRISLRQAQSNFIKFGAIEKKFLRNLRKPNKNDERNPNWKHL
jgi:hypothetical protein